MKTELQSIVIEIQRKAEHNRNTLVSAITEFVGLQGGQIDFTEENRVYCCPSSEGDGTYFTSIYDVDGDIMIHAIDEEACDDGYESELTDLSLDQLLDVAHNLSL